MHAHIVTLSGDLRKPEDGYGIHKMEIVWGQLRNEYPGKNWWARKDLNLGPMDYESTALTAELRARLPDVKTFYSTAIQSSAARLSGGVTE